MNSLPITTPRQDAWLASLPVPILIMILALVLGGGCSPSARPSDPEEGRQALQTMLDAWKAGGQPASLAQGVPSIHASDGDWMAGQALQDYRTGQGQLVGSDLNYPVELVLRNRKGRVTRKHATYAVTTHPQLLVLRSDE